MKKFLVTSLFIIFLLFWCLQAKAQKLPNIVLYLSDDQSQADVSVYGAHLLQTPTADKLASAGLTFNNAFVASPACAPSRAALLTGLMPARNGAEGNHTYPKPGTLILTQKLQEAGYKVLGFGKVAHGSMNEGCGYDFYSRSPVTLYDNVVEYFKNNNPGQPICLMVGDRRPHVPWTTDNLYDPASLKLPSFFIDTKETRQHWAQYYSDITGFDNEMGRVYRLAQEKFGDNFIFIYSSDHGGQWPFHKWNLYDAGIKVPLIVVWPGNVKPNTRTDAMVSWIDIFPTLLEITGSKIPENIDGKSFMNVLNGRAKNHRDYIFTTHSQDRKMNVYPIRSVRDKRYKYIVNLRPDCYHSNHSDLLRRPNSDAYWHSWDEAAKKDPQAAAIVKKYQIRPAEEFFDLQSDPNEQVNLIGSKNHQRQINKMRAMLESWMKEQGDTKRLTEEPYTITGPRPYELGIGQ
jgi:N-sulfoglucosamine sulfohydrolase